MSLFINGEWLYTADAHVHTFPDKIAEKAAGRLASISGIKPYTDGTFAQTQQCMKKGIGGVSPSLYIVCALKLLKNSCPEKKTDPSSCLSLCIGSV